MGCMARQLFLRLNNYAPFDSTDDLANKAVEMPGDRFNLLWMHAFLRAWNKSRKLMKKAAEDKNRPTIHHGSIPTEMGKTINQAISGLMGS
jgi:hypothetical protein